MPYDSWSDEQKAGQRMMVGFTGTQFNDELRYAIDTIKVSGIILFSRNIDSPEQLATLCQSAQDYTKACGQPPLFIAVDQEGGVVARLKPPFTQFAGNPSMQKEQDAIDFALTTARELTGVGINMNMAPVLDVPPEKGPSVMMERAFGRDPQWIAKMGATVIEHLQENGIMAVGKHFPGIGRTVLDSHHDLPDLDIEVQSLHDRDLVPFQAAMHAGVSAIMLSHIRYTGIDAVWPAGLSTAIVRGLLRQELKYGGMLITDDLDMGAVAKHYQIQEIVTQCLSATVDILLICHSGPKIKATHDAIHQIITGDETAAALCKTSIERIMATKQHFGLHG